MVCMSGDHLPYGPRRGYVVQRNGNVEPVLEFGDHFEDLQRVEPEIGDQITRERRLNRPAADILQHVDHTFLDRNRCRLRHREVRVRIASGSQETINEHVGDNDVFMTRIPAAAALIACVFAAVAAAQIDPRTALVERAAWSALNAGQARRINQQGSRGNPDGGVRISKGNGMFDQNQLLA